MNIIYTVHKVNVQDKYMIVLSCVVRRIVFKDSTVANYERNKSQSYPCQSKMTGFRDLIDRTPGKIYKQHKVLNSNTTMNTPIHNIQVSVAFFNICLYKARVLTTPTNNSAKA